MSTLDPAAIMAEHEGHSEGEPCYPRTQWDNDGHCLPYRLAAENVRLTAQVAAVEALAQYLDSLAPGDQHYAERIRAALAGVQS